MNSGRGVVVAIAFVAHGLRGQQHDQRPQALAAACYDILRYLRDEGDVAFEAVPDQRVDGPHIVVREPINVVDRQGNRCVFGGLHDAAIMPDSAGVGEPMPTQRVLLGTLQAIEFR